MSAPPRRRPVQVPVLIAGAGPAGLTAAIALSRLGVECLLVERRRELSGLPRATAISTRSMELLRAWGLEEEVLSGGIEVEWRQWFCDTLATAKHGYGSPTGLPTREQSALVSPTAPACVPQDHLEPVMLDHLRSLPGARIELGTEIVALENQTGGVRATLRAAETGSSRQVEAEYLIAADGAHSTVRGALGIGMHGPDRLLDAVSVLFRAPIWKLLGDLRYGLYATRQPAADGVFLPAGRGDRWLYAGMRSPAEAGESPDEADLVARIRAGAGVGDLEPRLERVGSFSFAAQMAERFRAGNAFLVGDAAHRVTPRGGTGMNTAIHDGYDIGWKLGWALRGWAGEGLLDSYEAERRPVAQHNVSRSADPEGTARDAASELQVDLGGRLKHVWTTAPSGLVSTLDLLGEGLTLFTGPDGPSEVEARPHVTVRHLDTMTARATGVPPGGSLLVRPDGITWGAANQAASAPSLGRTQGATCALHTSDRGRPQAPVITPRG